MNIRPDHIRTSHPTKNSSESEMKQTFDIRGGFGTQLLSMLAISAHYKTNIAYLNFRVNVGEYKEDLAYIAALDGIRLANLLNIHIQFSRGTNKTSPFRDPYKQAILNKHVREINPFTLPEDQQGSFIHIRKNDRQLLTDAEYETLQRNHPTFEVIQEPERFNLVDNLNNTVEDFFQLFSAKEIIGQYSTFTLACAILNDGVELHIVRPEDSNGPGKMSEEDWKFVDEVIQSYENIHWYTP